MKTEGLRVALSAAMAGALLVPGRSARAAAIHDAARANDPRGIAAALASAGPGAVNASAGPGITPLHVAAGLNRRAAAATLIENGAALNARTAGGFTPLHWAASRDAADAARLLIGAGADAGARAAQGITPLHWAAARNATNVLALLLAAGADHAAPTAAGLTPLHWAVEHGRNEAAVLLAAATVDRETAAAGTPPAAAPAEDAQDSAPPENIVATVSEYQALLRTIAAENGAAAAADAADRSGTADPGGAEAAPAAGDVPLTAPTHARPAFGKILRVPIGIDEELVFVWIEPLGIWVGEYEVTNGQYRCFRPRHRSLFFERHSLDGDDQPVVNVSWNDAADYCAWLNKFCGDRIPLHSAYRLPTDREWTAFARCGTERKYPWGDAMPPAYGNYSDFSARALPGWRGFADYNDGFAVSCPVSRSGANEWGLYGVGGNVWEWCADRFDAADPARSRRGGCWDFDGETALRVEWRGVDRPEARYDTIGFRIVVAKKAHE
ncbi:MAG: hypothetical protein FJ225_03770 [Lentisphaerae bacterium]|nr:hypothetical protein [Lentisphaerota bacterium]